MDHDRGGRAVREKTLDALKRCKYVVLTAALGIVLLLLPGGNEKKQEGGAPDAAEDFDRTALQEEMEESHLKCHLGKMVKHQKNHLEIQKLHQKNHLEIQQKSQHLIIKVKKQQLIILQVMIKIHQIILNRKEGLV